MCDEKNLYEEIKVETIDEEDDICSNMKPFNSEHEHRED